MMELAVVPRIDDAGPEWDPLFTAPRSPQCCRAWFQATEAAAIREGAAPHYILLRDDGRPAALIPLLAGPGRQMTSLTSPYTILFQPLLAAGTDAAKAGAMLGRHLRAWPITVLEAMDPAWPPLAPLLSGMAQAGLIQSRFDHFGNWHEPVSGLDWAAYLAARPGSLRETIRRKSAIAAKDGHIRFEVIHTRAGLDAAIEAYEEVYARSWKVPETFPAFTAALLHRFADLGLLRLSIMWHHDTPIAAQYWTVMDGTATVMKLAHDASAKTFSPGTVLTAHTIRLLLETETLQWLDFGRGDDPYKQQWTSQRRQRIGIMLTNPLHPSGLLATALHWAGRARRRLQRH